MPTQQSGLGERVKIAATIGPASRDKRVLGAMLLEGVDAVRINASHTDPDAVKGWVRIIRSASKLVGRDAAVLLDLQGIKWRIGDLKEPVPIKKGETVTLGAPGDGRIPLNLRPIKRHLKPGMDVFLDDGFLRLQVLQVSEREILCEVIRDGIVRSRAGLNLPGVASTAPIPTKRDLEHIRAGIAAGVDLFALSFVRSAKDLWRCRKHTKDIPIIAKIELPEAVDRIDEIADASDGIMVARGDLAVEMVPEMLPVLQKRLVSAANRARKPVIVATEMLASMVTAPRPTRAELTDVGNAVLEGADCTMLSDETAVGFDPPRAVRYMAKVIEKVEQSLLTYHLDMPYRVGETRERPDWAIADAAVETAAKVDARAIVAITGSGRTARLISAGRPKVPIFSFSSDPATRRRTAVMWGVIARSVRKIRNADQQIEVVLAQLRDEGCLATGDRVVVCYGSPLWAEGTKTNALRVAVV